MALHCDVTFGDKNRQESWLERRQRREKKDERDSKELEKRGDAANQDKLVVLNGIDLEVEKETEVEVEVETERDLDCGYAWLILIIMFLLNSTLSGASRVYGIIYARQVEINYYDREQASWPIATSSTIENLFGILTPALAQFISWKQIELLSTSLFVLSNLLAYFSSSLTLDIISLGLIQGIGLSMNTVIIMALNNDYFERYRTTAYGIALSGSTFGLLYMNPLVSRILSDCSGGEEEQEGEKETFRNVYLAIACVCLLNYPLIALIVPRNNKQEEKKKKKEVENEKEAPVCSHNNGINNKSCLENGEETYCRKISSCLNNYFARNDSFAFVDLNECYSRQDNHSSDWRRVRSTNFLHSANGCSRKLSNYFEHPISAKQHLSYCTRRSLSANELARNKVGQIRAHSMIVLNPSYLSCSPAAYKRGETSESSDTKKAIQARTLVKISSRGPKMELASKQSVPPISTVCSQNDASFIKQASSHSIDGQRIPKKSVVSFHIDLESNYSNTSEQSNRLYNRTLSIEQLQTCSCSVKSVNDELSENLFSMELILKLLKMPCLHCVWMMLTIYYLLSRVFIMIIVDFGKDRNLEPIESNSLLNYWSFGEICGRIILASIIDLRWLSVKSCILMTCSFLSLSIFSLVLVGNYLIGYYFYASCLTTVAALVSLEYVLINVVLLDYMTPSSTKSFSSNYVQITTCYSIGSFISSLLLFSRPALIGLYRDKLGSYDGLLLLLATLPIVFALLFALIEPSMRSQEST